MGQVDPPAWPIFHGASLPHVCGDRVSGDRVEFIVLLVPAQEHFEWVGCHSHDPSPACTAVCLLILSLSAPQDLSADLLSLLDALFPPEPRH